MGEKKVLKEIRKKLEKKIDVEKVFLYGSRARGTYRQDSDYDIAVISKDFEGMSRQERFQLLIDDVRSVLGDTPVDLVCYTPQEFEEGSESFLPAIIQEEGISI